MITTILTIISTILGIAGGLVERHYSPEAIKRREGVERDEEIVEKNHAAKSARLSNLLDGVRSKNRSNPRR